MGQPNPHTWVKSGSAPTDRGNCLPLTRSWMSVFQLRCVVLTPNPVAPAFNDHGHGKRIEFTVFQQRTLPGLALGI